jgi:hypothetical protein
MDDHRIIDGVQHCLIQEYANQAVYEPCPAPPTTAAVFGLGTIAALMVLTVAVVIPEIDRRRTQYQSVILNAKRSL